MTQPKKSKTSTQLKYIEKNNFEDREPEYVIIWLHGLGASSSDFMPIVPELKLKSCIKFVFPDAPVRPITINNGYKMQAWYDIRDLTKLGDTVDYIGIKESVAQIEELIELQIKNGFEARQIFLAGFSQGGAVCYCTLLTTPHLLRGAIILSGYLPDTTLLESSNSCVNVSTPILACHGKQDTVVPYSLGMATYEELKKLKLNVVWRSYTMEHTVSLDEVDDIALWINDKT